MAVTYTKDGKKKIKRQITIPHAKCLYWPNEKEDSQGGTNSRQTRFNDVLPQGKIEYLQKKRWDLALPKWGVYFRG